MAGNAGLFKFLKPSLRPQRADFMAAAFWGVAATSTAVWLIQFLEGSNPQVKLYHQQFFENLEKRDPEDDCLEWHQPFDWLKQQFTSTPTEGSA